MWTNKLKGDPIPWLLEEDTPAVHHADLLQNLSALCESGFAKDARLHPTTRWLLSQQDDSGRWRNQRAYNGKTWVDFEPQGQPSKWVTLRACTVLKQVYG